MATRENKEKIDLQMILDQFRSDYERTNNPLYIWEAIYTVFSHDVFKNKKYPSWIVKYIEDCARFIIGLKSGIDWQAMIAAEKANNNWMDETVWRIENIAASEYLTRTLNILGFSRRGFNAFVEYKNSEEKVDDWFYYLGLIDEGKTGAKALEEVMEFRGTSDERTVRRRLAEARNRYTRSKNKYQKMGKSSA